MVRKLLLLIIGLCLTSNSESPLLLKKGDVPFVIPKKETTNPIVLKTITTKNLTLNQISFEQLPGWDDTNVQKSLIAFQRSCEVFLKQEPEHMVGSKIIHLKVKDWHPACKAALHMENNDEASARLFFETWFYPIEFSKTKSKSIRGLFTGYYMPLINGALTKTKKYNTPIYGLPHIKHLSQYTREKIDNGALGKRAPVIAWIDSPVERLFMEIEGAGVIQLPSGKHLYLGYAGENGAPYTSIGHVLIKNGALQKDKASKNSIKRYLNSRVEKGQAILHRNKSFVFFKNLKQTLALGAQGIGLTPGYSLAVDKNWVPLGAPLWLSTYVPREQEKNYKKFQRLMIAQDTGGAIKGLMRGDIYWGSGKKATYLGEHMKNEGHYWLFLPKHAFDKLAV